MKINRKNYESYFIDLLDGTLTTEQVDNLLDFLRENPDLAEELKDLEKIKVSPAPANNTNFNYLLKNEFDQPDIFEETCIRSIENDLSQQEENAFQHYIQSHAQATHEYHLFKATIAEPDPLITFKNINHLKKTKRLSPIWYAVAAILTIGLFFWFSYTPQPKGNTYTKVIALNEKPKVKLQLNEYHPQMLKMDETNTTQSEIYLLVVNENETAKNIIIEQLALMIAKPTLATIEQSNTNIFALQMPNKQIESSEKQLIYPDAIKLLANKIDDIDPKQEVNNFAHFALNKLRNVTNDKLDYKTNNKGKLNKIEFNSRLLAFSVPLHSKKN